MINNYTYKGFSFKNFEKNKSFIIKDLELVKEDLINHIYTRFGERVKMANFGTRIPDLVFEPLDIESLTIINEDLDDVFNYDPRVQLINLDIIPDFDENIVLAYAELFYVELNLKDTLHINIQLGE
jgi:phage baseplate assembly protein W